MKTTDIDGLEQDLADICVLLALATPWAQPTAGVYGWVTPKGWVAKPPSDALMDMQRQLTQAQYKAVPGLDNAIKAHSRTPEPTARMGNEWT